jgi:hypothetical protein
MSKIAAIDVGSNAMRMVIGEVDEAWRVKLLENIRLPMRLGQDVFSKGYLGQEIIQQTKEAFLRFKHVADNYGVQRLRAVATSAAREASKFADPAGLVYKRYRTGSDQRGRGGASDPPGGCPCAKFEKQTDAFDRYRRGQCGSHYF